MSVIAVIPARSGSKRIPGKNIKKFLGVPIIQRVIETTLASQIFDRVVVTTDCKDIARIAINAGAEAPFLRDETLSDDYTPTIDVMADALTRLSVSADTSDFSCCIYATACFLQPKLLSEALALLLSTPEIEYALTVSEFAHPIQRGFSLVDGGHLQFAKNLSSASIRTQDLDKMYHDAAQFYFGRNSAFLTKIPLLSSHAHGLIIPKNLAWDIDEPEDWEIAEALFLRNKALTKNLNG
jgi:pseudaminic acid cytidylyltransferase